MQIAQIFKIFRLRRATKGKSTSFWRAAGAKILKNRLSLRGFPLEIDQIREHLREVGGGGKIEPSDVRSPRSPKPQVCPPLFNDPDFSIGGDKLEDFH